MKQIHIKDDPASTPLIYCQWCGGVTRLFGSEPHPVRDGIDLLSYVCAACDEFTVFPSENPASLQ